MNKKFDLIVTCCLFSSLLFSSDSNTSVLSELDKVRQEALSLLDRFPEGDRERRLWADNLPDGSDSPFVVKSSGWTTVRSNHEEREARKLKACSEILSEIKARLERSAQADSNREET